MKVEHNITLLVPTERIGYGVAFHLKNAENGKVEATIENISQITINSCTIARWTIQDTEKAVNFSDYIEQINEMKKPLIITCYTIPDGQRFLHIASESTSTTSMFIQTSHSTFSPHRNKNWRGPFNEEEEREGDE